MIEESVPNSKPTIRDLTIGDVGELMKSFLWATGMYCFYIGLPVAAWKYFEMGQAIPDTVSSLGKYIFFSLFILLAIYDLPGMLRSLANGLNELAQCASDFNRFWQLVILSGFLNLFYFWEDYPNLCLYTLILVVAPLVNTYDTYRDIMTSKQ